MLGSEFLCNIVVCVCGVGDGGGELRVILKLREVRVTTGCLAAPPLEMKKAPLIHISNKFASGVYGASVS